MEGRREAWVTLVTNDEYSKGALCLGQSLRDVGTTRETVVMATEGVSNPVRDQLRSIFDHVVSVEELDSGDRASLSLLGRPELGVTLTKVNAWLLTDFEKAVFLDADCIVLQNCDELFDRDEISAVADCGWPDCFNSGVFVFRPSTRTYEELVQLAAREGTFDGGDQGLLNMYWADWQQANRSHHLPFKYNLNANVSYTYVPAFARFGNDARIVHFLGSHKPWRMMRFSSGEAFVPDSCAHSATFVNQWWQTYDRAQNTLGMEKVDPTPTSPTAAVHPTYRPIPVGLGPVPFRPVAYPLTSAPHPSGGCARASTYTFDDSAQWRNPEYKTIASSYPAHEHEHEHERLHVHVHDMGPTSPAHVPSVPSLPVEKEREGVETGGSHTLPTLPVPPHTGTEGGFATWAAVGGKEDHETWAYESGHHDSGFEPTGKPVVKRHFMDRFWETGRRNVDMKEDEEGEEKGGEEGEGESVLVSGEEGENEGDHVTGDGWIDSYRGEGVDGAEDGLKIASEPGTAAHAPSTGGAHPTSPTPAPSAQTLPILPTLPILAPFQGVPYNPGLLSLDYADREWEKMYGKHVIEPEQEKVEEREGKRDGEGERGREGEKEEGTGGFHHGPAAPNRPVPPPPPPRWNFATIQKRLNDVIPPRPVTPEAEMDEHDGDEPEENWVLRTNQLIREVDSGIWRLSQSLARRTPSEEEQVHLRELVAHLAGAQRCIELLTQASRRREEEEDKSRLAKLLREAQRQIAKTNVAASASVSADGKGVDGIKVQVDGEKGETGEEDGESEGRSGGEVYGGMGKAGTDEGVAA